MHQTQDAARGGLGFVTKPVGFRVKGQDVILGLQDLRDKGFGSGVKD